MIVEAYLNGVLDHSEIVAIDENDIFSMHHYERLEREARPGVNLSFKWRVA